MRPAQWALVAVLLSVLLGARSAAAKPFDLSGHDWEGCADLAQLARAELGTHAYPTSSVELGDLTPEDALILIHPEQPLDFANLGSFMRAGGRVVLLDDFGRGDGLLRYFGIQRVALPIQPAEMLRHNPQLPIAEPAGPHPLTSGVGRVVLNHATGVTNPDLSPILVVRGQGEPDVLVAISGTVLKGRLFVVGDASIVMNSMLRYPGNKALAKNMLAYAASADAPDRKPGRVFLLSGAFDLRGGYGNASDRSAGAAWLRAIRDFVATVQHEGMPPFVAYFLSVSLGLALVLWTGSRAGKVHSATTPRYSRPIPLAAQGGVAGHAAVVGGDRTSRALALLELKSALEEDLTILLGLDRVPAADVLVAHVVGSRLLDADASRSLRQLLLRMAKIETMMLSPNNDGLRRIRDREVIVTAATVKRLLYAARRNAEKAGAGARAAGRPS
jgi:hypothetical protein